MGWWCGVAGRQAGSAVCSALCRTGPASASSVAAAALTWQQHTHMRVSVGQHHAGGVPPWTSSPWPPWPLCERPTSSSTPACGVLAAAGVSAAGALSAGAGGAAARQRRRAGRGAQALVEAPLLPWAGAAAGGSAPGWPRARLSFGCGVSGWIPAEGPAPVAWASHGSWRLRRAGSKGAGRPSARPLASMLPASLGTRGGGGGGVLSVRRITAGAARCGWAVAAPVRVAPPRSARSAAAVGVAHAAHAAHIRSSAVAWGGHLEAEAGAQLAHGMARVCSGSFGAPMRRAVQCGGCVNRAGVLTCRRCRTHGPVEQVGTWPSHGHPQ